MPNTARSFVVVGDLHLSAHAGTRVGDKTVDALGRMLARLADEPVPPTVVFNGDFVDLELSRPVPRRNAAERLADVLDRYPALVDLLGTYLRRGGRVVILSGNHDAEWCRPEVRKLLAERLAETGGPPPDGSLVFHDGAFVSPGRFYIEHGHQFDPDNRVVYRRARGRTDDEPPEIVRPLGAVLTRHLLSAMPDDAFFEDEGKTPLPLLLKALSRGVTIGPRLVFLYYRAALRALAASLRNYLAFWTGLPGVDATPTSDRAGDFGRSFWADSTMESPLRVIRRTYLDRTAMTAALVALMAWIAISLQATAGTRAGLCAVVCLSAALLVIRLPDRYNAKAESRLREAAEAVSRRLGVPFVLFGHVHDEFHDEGVYLNAGRFLRRHDGADAIHYVRLSVTDDGCTSRVCRRAVDAE